MSEKKKDASKGVVISKRVGLANESQVANKRLSESTERVANRASITKPPPRPKGK